MRQATIETGTVSTAHEVLELATSGDLYLSVYLTTPPQEVLREAVKVRLRDALDELGEQLEDTPWERPFREERPRVEGLVEDLRPGSDGLAIFSSREAEDLRAMWLPSVGANEVRFGPGTYVMPMMEVLDEWEPIGLARVAKNWARLIVSGLGRLDEVREFETFLPGKHDQGGLSQARYGRHHEEHAAHHLREVAGQFREMVREWRLLRVFLAGPVDPLTTFKGELHEEVAGKITAEVPVEEDAPDEEAIAKVRPYAMEAERADEAALVEEIITRAEKDSGAVLGVGRVLEAVHKHEVYKLVLAADCFEQVDYYLESGMLASIEAGQTESLSEPWVRMPVRKELPGYVMRQGMQVEVVYHDAAKRLLPYGGLGALLKIPKH